MSADTVELRSPEMYGEVERIREGTRSGILGSSQSKYFLRVQPLNEISAEKDPTKEANRYVYIRIYDNPKGEKGESIGFAFRIDPEGLITNLVATRQPEGPQLSLPTLKDLSSYMSLARSYHERNMARRARYTRATV